MAESESRSRRSVAILAASGLAIALVAAIGALAAASSYRWELSELGTAFTVLRWAAYAGIGAVALSLVGSVVAAICRHRGVYVALSGLGIGLLVVGLPYHQLRIARSVPPIHDITTDMVDPPQFVAVIPLRAGSPNSVTYGGLETARQQRQAYPDIGPARLGLPPAAAFEQGLEVARDLGWHIVFADAAEGRIEATDRTFWFGFTDDVVIRVQADPDGSRVDVRSVSRVGRSDVGANARRIRRYLKALHEATGP